MLPDRVSNPGPLTYESGALPIALRAPVISILDSLKVLHGESSYSVTHLALGRFVKDMRLPAEFKSISRKSSFQKV